MGALGWVLGRVWRGLGEALGAHVEWFWGHFGVSFSEWVREAPWDRFWAHLGAQNGSKIAPQGHLEEVPTPNAENRKNCNPSMVFACFGPQLDLEHGPAEGRKPCQEPSRRQDGNRRRKWLENGPT